MDRFNSSGDWCSSEGDVEASSDIRYSSDDACTLTDLWPRSASLHSGPQTHLQEKYDALLHLSDLIPWETDAQGNATYLGDRWPQPSLEALGSGWIKALHPDDVESTLAVWKRAVETGNDYSAQFRLKDAAVEWRWYQARAVAKRAADSAITGWFGILLDCHDKKVADDALAATEARYRLVARATSDCIWDWDLTTGQIVRSETIEAHFGYPEGRLETGGSWWRERIHPADRERAVQSIEAAIAHPLPDRWMCEYRFRRADGSYAHVCDRGYLIRDETGKAVRMVGAVLDLSERVAHAQALREKDERYTKTVELTAQLPWMANGSGRLTELSPEASKLLDIDQEELAASITHALHPEDVTLTGDKWRAALASGDTFDHELRLRLKDGHYHWFRIRAAAHCSTAGEIERWYGTAEDIHLRKLASEATDWRANHDALTGLVNRQRFQECAERELLEADRNDATLSLIVFDLDDFKHVNDQHGHDAGDELLVRFAQKLTEALPEAKLVARLGGDEFAALLGSARSSEDLINSTNSILSHLHSGCPDSSEPSCFRASAGAAIFPQHGHNVDELLKSADIALYDAKQDGGGTARIFVSPMRARLQKQNSMISVARAALHADRVLPFYQPKVCLRSGKVHGFEALLRWLHADGSIQFPGTISAAFDNIDLANEISERMFDRVLADIQKWRDQGTSFGRIAINASSAEFKRGDFGERVLGRLQSAAVPASCIEIEVTESVFVEEATNTVERALQQLSSAGVTVALDDFGTGYASLTHLRRFPVKAIKIDRSFISGSLDDKADSAIVGAVVGLGRNMDMLTIAEGVETAEQATTLREIGCNFGQGYLFGRAVPAAEVQRFL